MRECFRALVSILKRQARTRACFSFRGSPPLLCPKRTWVFNHEGSKERSYQEKAHCPCSWKPGLGADAVVMARGKPLLGQTHPGVCFLLRPLHSQEEGWNMAYREPSRSPGASVLLFLGFLPKPPILLSGHSLGIQHKDFVFPNLGDPDPIKSRVVCLWGQTQSSASLSSAC